MQLCQVGQLLTDAHLRIEAPLFGHVTDSPAGLELDGGSRPAHLARIGEQHAEHDPHGGGLAGPVAAHETEYPPRPDLEAEVIHRHEVAVSLGYALNLESERHAQILP